MVAGANNNNKRYWYKVSVDTVRAWTSILMLLTIFGGGFVGYRLLSRHLLEREVMLALEEVDALVKRLQQERGITGYREKFATAKSELTKAREHYKNGEFPDALGKAERSRSVLVSIVDSMRNRSPAGEAQFITTTGGVEVRRGERGDWRPARGRMVIHGGDYIKTSGTGSAEIMMVDGTLFTVRPSTVVLVNRARPSGQGRLRRSIALESGWVNLSTTNATSRVTTPKAEAEVRERSEAMVSYDAKRGEGKFAAFRGALRVASKEDDSVRMVGELEQVVQAGGVISKPRRVPDPPQPVSPKDNSEFYLEGSRQLALVWRAVKGAERYALQVSGNRLFVDNIIDTDRRRKTRATLGLRGAGSFVWRVAAFDSESERGPWSPVRRFRVLASEQTSRSRAGSRMSELSSEEG